MIRQTVRLCQARCICYTAATTLRRFGSSKVALAYPTSSSFLRRLYALSTQGEDVDSLIDKLSTNEYNKVADEYLETIGDELEVLSEDFPQLDCELNHGVMTIILPPNGTYVINKQPPNKQIWLSSPISGPQRYDMVKRKWITLRDGSSLTDLLEKEISEALDTDFKFDGVKN